MAWRRNQLFGFLPHLLHRRTVGESLVIPLASALTLNVLPAGELDGRPEAKVSLVLHDCVLTQCACAILQDGPYPSPNCGPESSPQSRVQVLQLPH